MKIYFLKSKKVSTDYFMLIKKISVPSVIQGQPCFCFEREKTIISWTKASFWEISFLPKLSGWNDSVYRNALNKPPSNRSLNNFIQKHYKD